MLWMARAMDVGARIASSVSPNKPKLTILLLPSEPAKGAPARVCHAISGFGTRNGERGGRRPPLGTSKNLGEPAWRMVANPILVIGRTPFVVSVGRVVPRDAPRRARRLRRLASVPR